MAERRLPVRSGEAISRGYNLMFTFDGRRYEAYEGDTVGSALAAANVSVLSRSFKYHRPRGLVCCAGRCPNCMVEVDGTPNVRACIEPVRDGMVVKGQNAWPSVHRDAIGVLDRLDRVLPAGFYYKTFIRPRFMWPAYEGVLRRLAGLGKVDIDARPELNPRKRHLNCDVAVVGGGPAGCLAAIEAAAMGASVVLIDDQPQLGGHLRTQSAPAEGDSRITGLAGFEAAARLATLVKAERNIEHLANATAFGLYEGKLLGVTQANSMIRVRASQIVISTGAAERPVLFQDNDRPGVMLGSAVLRLARLFGVNSGNRAVVVTDDDHGWRTAAELIEAGIKVAAVVDSRDAEPPQDLARRVNASGAVVLTGADVVRARGRAAVKALLIDVKGVRQVVQCDLVALSFRPEPVISLLAHEGVSPRFDAALNQFVPGVLTDGIYAAGHVEGIRDEATAVARGVAAGRNAAEAAHGKAVARPAVQPQQQASVPQQASAHLELPGGRKTFVCICEDVTVKDVKQAVSEGFDNLETLKRYSTVTMGPCQGKMCHSLSARVHAAITGQSVATTGLTTARPPFQPVPLAALAGPHLAPVRQTAMHDRHSKLDATWMDMGEWKRPLLYTSVGQECKAVREAVGVIDVSTLGKLELRGADAGAFLDWMHPNRFSDLRIGRVRYRAMCDDAGIVIDDGTVARLGPDRFFLTTTTGTLDAVEQWFKWWLAGSSRDVQVINVTSEYAAINLAGPRARDVIARLTTMDVSSKAMPYLAAIEGEVAGVPAVILRIGFVGEMGYEIHVPADYGAHLWDAVFEAGRDLGIAAFGIESQRVLRLEKLHLVVGQDTDALSNPIESGLDWLVKADKPDFIGRDALAVVQSRGRKNSLAGFEVTGAGVPAEGAAIVRNGQSIGRVTSCKWSPTLNKAIGMCWVPAEDAVNGRELTIRLGVGTDGKTTTGKVQTRPFYDPEGARLRM